MAQEESAVGNLLICLICGEEGAKKHYGSVCCIGCKHFFRRSILENRNYECKFSNNCVIDKINRILCRYCRFQKCIQYGMNRKNIREQHSKVKHESGARKLLDLNENFKKTVAKVNNPRKYFENDASTSKANSDTVEEHEIRMIFNACQHFTRNKNLPLGTFKIIPNYMDEITSITKYFILVDRLCDIYSDSNIQLLSREFQGKCSVNVTLDEAIQEPRKICHRTAVEWEPKEIIKTSLNQRTWCRVLTLYLDWASHIKELDQLSTQDKKLQLGGRIIAATSLICGYKSAVQNVNGIVLSGGTYFPMNRPKDLEYNMRLLTCFMEYQIKGIIEPMKKLKVTDGEISLLRVISSLTPVPGLSPNAQVILTTARNKYVDALAEIVRKNRANTGALAILNRMTNLMAMIMEADKVAEMADHMMGYMSAFSLGEIRGTLPYQIHIDRYNSLNKMY